MLGNIAVGVAYFTIAGFEGDALNWYNLGMVPFQLLQFIIFAIYPQYDQPVIDWLAYYN